MVADGGSGSHEGWDIDGGNVVGGMNTVSFLNFVRTRAESFIGEVIGLVCGEILGGRIHGSQTKMTERSETKNLVMRPRGQRTRERKMTEELKDKATKIHYGKEQTA